MLKNINININFTKRELKKGNKKLKDIGFKLRAPLYIPLRAMNFETTLLSTYSNNYSLKTEKDLYKMI